MKKLLRSLVPASLILLFCLPSMAQDEKKDYPNFQLLSDAEQAAYDSAPSLPSFVGPALSLPKGRGKAQNS